MLNISMDELKFSEIVKSVESLDSKDKGLKNINIAFLRNITLDAMAPYLKFQIYREGFKPQLYMGDYDSIMPDVLGSKSKLYEFKPDIIALCLNLKSLSEDFSFNFTALKKDDIVQEKERIIEFIDSLLSGIRKNTKSSVLVHNFEVPVFPSLGILDSQIYESQVNSVREINMSLLKIISKYDSVYIVDVDLIRSRLGYEHFYDKRYWHIGRAPYTREGYKRIALEYMKFIRALQ